MTYGYDGASRLETVQFDGHTVTYSYDPTSVTRLAMDYDNGTQSVLTVEQDFDRLDRLTGRRSTAGAQMLGTTYYYDNLNRRTKATRLGDSSYWDYGYDARGQVTSGEKKNSTGAAVPGHDFQYQFDDIGNRGTAGRNGQTSDYTANALNQYTSRTMPRVIDVVGSANETASVVVEGEPASGREGSLFFHQVDFSGEPGASAAQWREVVITGTLTGGGFNGGDRVATEKRDAYIPGLPVVDQHDADGNLLQDERWRYTWNAENRLIAMETRQELIDPLGPLPASERKRLEFVYDSTGRRIQKRVLGWSGGQWSVVLEARFLYNRWNLVAELTVASPQPTVHRTYAWGLDLSGTLQGAGGVGGLLGITDLAPANSYLPTFDGNGNITALIRASDSAMVAEYDYGPFGELVVDSGSAELSPFRFSTKYTDEESGLLYYGFRYCNASTGRWLSRDPIQERGGVNLYGMVGNDSINRFDPFGFREYVKRVVRAHYTLVRELDLGHIYELSKPITDIVGGLRGLKDSDGIYSTYEALNSIYKGGKALPPVINYIRSVGEISAWPIVARNARVDTAEIDASAKDFTVITQLTPPEVEETKIPPRVRVRLEMRVWFIWRDDQCDREMNDQFKKSGERFQRFEDWLYRMKDQRRQVRPGISLGTVDPMLWLDTMQRVQRPGTRVDIGEYRLEGGDTINPSPITNPLENLDMAGLEALRP